MVYDLERMVYHPQSIIQIIRKGINDMARTKRDNMKKQTASILNNTAKAVLTLNELHTEFEPHHPELANLLEAAMINIANQREIVLKFAMDAWMLDENGVMKYMS